MMIKQSTKLTKEKVLLAQENGCLDKVYGDEVNRLIRKRYSKSEELAIYRHMFNGAGETEFAEFNAYVEECKAKAQATIDSLLN